MLMLLMLVAIAGVFVGSYLAALAIHVYYQYQDNLMRRNVGLNAQPIRIRGGWL